MTLLLLAALLFPTLAQDRSAQRTLASFRDVARPLLIFAPRKPDSRLARQVQLLAGSAGLRERQVILLLCVPPAESGEPVASMLSPDAQQQARKRFGVAPADFAIILIGKDGGEKQRWREPVSAETLNQIIDSMPMRQDEMKQSPQKD